MKTKLLLTLLVLTLIAPAFALDPKVNYSQSSKTVFKDAIATASAGTVVVLCDKTEVALGAVVGADGWIITKASELTAGKITVKFKNGKTLAAKQTGVAYAHDIAMLKVEADDLTPVKFSDKKVEVGDWVATPSNSDVPVAVGVMSV